MSGLAWLLVGVALVVGFVAGRLVDDVMDWADDVSWVAVGWLKAALLVVGGGTVLWAVLHFGARVV